MNKYEFGNTLRKSLTGKLSPREVDSRVSYYENYIDAEIKNGRSEEEVMESLGDPRLIARTITDMAGTTDNVYSTDEPSVSMDNDKKGGFNFNGRVFRLPGWLIIIIIAIVVLLFINIIGFLAIRLAPLIFAFIIITWIIRFFTNNRR